jgi:hypothetical protein
VHVDGKVVTAGGSTIAAANQIQGAVGDAVVAQKIGQTVAGTGIANK